MAFIESPRFPDKISYGSSGGPMYNTNVTTVSSGYERRNQKWVQSRHAYDAQFGITTNERLSQLIDFFHTMKGKANTFRFKDWGDFKSCGLHADPASDDQEIGTGNSTDGTNGETVYQITKTYVAGLETERVIAKPVGTSILDSTVLVEVNGILVTENTNYTVEYSTGEITFLPTFVPMTGEVVKCGYEFDTPCRFNTDELNIIFDAYGIGNTAVPIIEVRI